MRLLTDNLINFFIIWSLIIKYMHANYFVNVDKITIVRDISLQVICKFGNRWVFCRRTIFNGKNRKCVCAYHFVLVSKIKVHCLFYLFTKKNILTEQAFNVII